jgi:hypothetical protein
LTFVKLKNNKKALLTIFVMFLTCISFLHGQESKKFKKLAIIEECRIPFEHKLILPSSIVLLNRNLDTIKYDSIDYKNQIIIISNCEELDNKEIEVFYRYFDIDIEKSYSIMDTSKMKMIDPMKNVYIFNPYASKESGIIASKGLNYNGSFSRGLAVGNSQSLVLNSNFDLQLSGDLGNGIRVLAAISDDNIPIQPEGNTQVLQEFDKVFIEVSKDRTSVIAGDFEIRRPVSYFMNFQKKLKGISVNNTSLINEKVSNQTVVNIASSRGKFARQILKTREGNQGPYRLQGNNNERFIIVLSNQEKVFFNGRLLKRGLEYDYIIDYNSAEITFTPRCIVAKETRIIIEFEYTDLNYFRSLMHVRNDVNAAKYNINFNFYTEQDSRNSTSQVELDSLDLEILKNSGDLREKSFRSGVRPINFEGATGNITYEVIPNPNAVVEGVPYILQFSQNPNFALVTSIFSDFGIGNGSYEVDIAQGLNGRVYRYVGKGKGRYEPMVELVPPEKRQLGTLGATYRFGKKSDARGELSFSNVDRNRFSSINNEDNVGLGSYFEVNKEVDLDSAKTWAWANQLKFEKLSNYFNPLNPYRNAEFNRDWNIDTLRLASQTLLQATTGLKSGRSNVFYDFHYFDLNTYFNGRRHSVKGTVNDLGWKGWFDIGLTNTDGEVKNSRFWRPNFDISHNLPYVKKLFVGMGLEGEDNRFTNKSDSLLTGSYAFQHWKYYLKTEDLEKFNFQFSFNQREDLFADGSVLTQSIDVREWEYVTLWQITKNHRLNITLKNRNFEVVRQDLVPGERSKNTLLGNIDHGLTFKGFQINSNYQLASGQEPKLEFIYQRIENNFGDFVYVGPDSASVKNIADFRYDPGNPNARYIRLALPNNEFISTDNVGFNHSLRISPSQWFADDMNNSKTAKFIKRFDNLFTLRNNLKTSTQNTERTLNPFLNTADTSLVSYNSIINNNLFYNRGNANFDVVLTTRNNNIKLNQLNGNESRSINENELRIRTKLYKSGDLIFNLGKGVKTYTVDLYKDRNFDIEFYRIITELNVRQNTNLRYILKYKFEVRDQLINETSQAKINDITAAANFRQINKSAIDISLTYAKVSYDGPIGQSIEFDMLDGLRSGQNVLWNASYTRRLNGVLDLSFRYEGRKTGLDTAIHIGRAQMKATF